MRETLDRIEIEANQVKASIDGFAADAQAKHKDILVISDELRALASATPGQAHDAASNPSLKEELSEAVQEIEQSAQSQRSGLQYRLMLMGAESREKWDRYVDIATDMASNCAEDPDDLAHALFAIAYGSAKMREHKKAAEGYEDYLSKCHFLDLQSQAIALNNWGIELKNQAVDKAYRDPREADKFWTLAFDKYASAVDKVPDDHEVLSNWGVALCAQAQTKKGRSRSALLKLAEEKLLRAHVLSGYRSTYNLACLAGLRGQSATAAKWLKHAKENDDRMPDCAKINTDMDFDRVRGSPVFKQALIDIGCAPAPQQEPTT